MTDTNRWGLISEKERLEVLDLPYGWMIRNILQYGNTLIPKKAIQKSSVRMIKSAIEQDLSDLGFEVRIKIIRYNAKEYRETDHVAEGVFTGERRRKKEKEMNYYKQFAEMLGLELEQEFVLTDADGNRKNKYTYKVTEDGVVYKSPTFINWSINSLGTIGSLLNGDVKAVPKPWKPENGDRYWYYSEAWDEENCVMWKDEFSDLLLWKAGNCFRTEKEAATKGKEVMEAIHKEYEES